jgi:hypothetical protein
MIEAVLQLSSKQLSTGQRYNKINLSVLSIRKAGITYNKLEIAFMCIWKAALINTGISRIETLTYSIY